MSTLHDHVTSRLDPRMKPQSSSQVSNSLPRSEEARTLPTFPWELYYPLRNRIHAERLRSSTKALEHFATHAFTNNELIAAYFHTRIAPGEPYVPGAPTSPSAPAVRPQAVISFVDWPYRLAHRAAERACRGPFIAEADVAPTHLATFLYHCGALRYWDSMAKAGRIPAREFNTPEGMATARALRMALLSDSLKYLSSHNAELGNTLSVVMEDERVIKSVMTHSPERVARIGGAIFFSRLWLHAALTTGRTVRP